MLRLVALVSVFALTQAFPSAVPCRAISDCLDGVAPTVTIFCTAGFCLGADNGKTCEIGPDCGILETCQGGTCVLGIAGRLCSSHADCYIGHGCQGGICLRGTPGSPCAAATGGIQCAHGNTCEAATGKCIPGESGIECTTHRNCRPGLYCAAGSCAYGTPPTPAGPGIVPGPEVSTEPSAAPVLAPGTLPAVSAAPPAVELTPAPIPAGGPTEPTPGLTGPLTVDVSGAPEIPVATPGANTFVGPVAQPLQILPGASVAPEFPLPSPEGAFPSPPALGLFPTSEPGLNVGGSPEPVAPITQPGLTGFFPVV